ncbi:Transducin/WD40 repeat-like superfamily protein [Quillaja saponaria]|uniref:Transducin/WD40 repeat-like superfamily protein n=1 Tax=Quillaja saponaria TaxID=32244 RepID=A0AAD7QFW3_QUISA|nr:Transducin/WD40 repeat-like superfamily protein [Quillaja saponaria]
MDKYVVPVKPSIGKLKPSQRHRWKRSAIELNGRYEPKYRHEISGLLMESYSEVGAFPHLYHVDGRPCQTHTNRIASLDFQVPCRKQGISALDFDNKGIYLASVTKSGCLTVHDFEALYCQIDGLSTCLKEDESKHLLHLSLNQQLDVVRWNSANQDEVVCTSVKNNEVLIFDVGYITSEPVEVLKTRHSVSIHGSNIHKGLSDVAFSDSRIIASDTHGVISVWDRRMNMLPCLELTTNSCSTLNSIQLNTENQIIFGAGKHGIVYMWDVRGGRSSTAFQSHKEVCHPPITSLKLATMLEKIGSLKAQTDIVPKEIHSINLDPSCPYQLAFHLGDGWSGVLDIYNLHVTHIHCPPPAWLNDSSISADLLNLRKPAWLPACSIYVVGSPSECGIHLLDFYPDPSSPSHVDYNEDMQCSTRVSRQYNQNRFLPLSECVTASAAHPLNGTIITGTKHSSLIMVSQMHQPC